ncbi:MAG: AbfB domain-containing protein [Planctomycetaceae bacterium]|nr:AbfB domain-containing protein [Planctomycetaceae bacterium]
MFMFLVLAGLMSAAQTPAWAQGPYAGYLMAHFTGESSMGEQIYFSVSTDGLHWSDVNSSGPVLILNVGENGVRDPSIIRSADGMKFWILATDLRIANGKGWDAALNRGSTSLVIWESTDLINWSQPWLVDVAGSIPTAGCAWAPEAIYDEENGNYVVYWTTQSDLDGIRKIRIYCAATTDFVNFSPAQLYINRPGTQGIIDTQIIEVNDANYKYYRASGDGQITIEAGNSILGTWTTIGNLAHLGITGSSAEGPLWYKFNDVSQWCLMVDQYSSGRGYLPLVSGDLSSTSNFSILSASEYSLGSNLKRHGSVLNITAAELAAIQAKWPPPAIYPGDVVASYNFPTRFFAHQGIGSQATIVESANTLPPGQWNIVPGLAGAGVSFESVEHPGHYLRHYAYVLYLNRYDGTDLFKQDATFHVKNDGWAGAGSTSFQSYNYPARYIRHYSYGLRIDEVTSGSSDSLKQDASFYVTVTPPAAPKALTARSGIDHVTINWDDNIERDLSSYNVYRSLSSGGPYTLIQNVVASEYLDNTVDNGTTYYYTVSATDTSGHVSAGSNEDSALPPDLTDDDKIDLADFVKIAEAWLTTFHISDLSVIAENWLAY